MSVAPPEAPGLMTTVVPSQANAEALTAYARDVYRSQGMHLELADDGPLNDMVTTSLLIDYLPNSTGTRPITVEDATTQACRYYHSVMTLYARNGAPPTQMYLLHGQHRQVCFLTDPAAGTDGILLPRDRPGDPFQVEFHEDARKVGMKRVSLHPDLQSRKPRMTYTGQGGVA